jgi:DNA-directed RNA polymerase beta subunit
MASARDFAEHPKTTSASSRKPVRTTESKSVRGPESKSRVSESKSAREPEGKTARVPESADKPRLYTDADFKIRAPQPTANPDNKGLEKVHLLAVLVASIRENGLVGHNITGYNKLLETGMAQILARNFKVERLYRNERAHETDHVSTLVQMQFTHLTVNYPEGNAYPHSTQQKLWPRDARLSGHTYGGATSLGLSVTTTARFADGHQEVKTVNVPPFQATRMPIMVQSSRCHLSNVSKEGRKSLGEDPSDLGAYFLAKGSEWVIDLSENIRFGTLHVHVNMAANELVRGEYLSQPGGGPYENSSQIINRLHTNSQFTVEINSVKLTKARIPFFLVYRMYGMTSDRDIVRTIVPDLDAANAPGGPPTDEAILQILSRALHLADATFADLLDELDVNRVVLAMAGKLSKYLTNPAAHDENTSQVLTESLMATLDRTLLPSIGMQSKDRPAKLRFLGYLIRKTLLVHLKIAPPTDRDNLGIKRVHGAGVSLAKAFKTHVNTEVVGPILKTVKRELKNNAFRSLIESNLVEQIRSAVSPINFERAMTATITTGANTSQIRVNRRVATHRVSAQGLDRKNELNTVSSMRTITAHGAANASKQTERADMMRRVHPTYAGYLCIVQSADTGENVGMSKQLACTAVVCEAGEDAPLRALLLSDREYLVPIGDVDELTIHLERRPRLFLNGEPIAAGARGVRAVAVAKRWRNFRRASAVIGNPKLVSPWTSIVFETIANEVHFWLDVGRIARPLLIVFNNQEEYDASRRTRGAKPVPFWQNIWLTMQDVMDLYSGKKKSTTLVAEGKVEFITPEEQANCLIAPSLDDLRKHESDVTLPFTHCDIEQALFGLAGLTSPFANHTQPARVTYQTNQGKATAGWFALNFPFMFYKNRFHQILCETPLVGTVAQLFVRPNGFNLSIAYMSFTGDNMEDSAIVCKESADAGLFAGAWYRVERSEQDKDELFMSPDPMTTRDLKPGANYEGLEDGVLPVGTVAKYNDVLIAKVAVLPAVRSPSDPEAKYRYACRSLVYKNTEPAIVDAMYKSRGVNDEPFITLRLRYQRPLGVGDKMCLDDESDVLTSRGWVKAGDVRMADLIACLGANGLEYCRPSAVVSYAHDGIMYEIQTAAVNQCVTAEHKMYIRRVGEDCFKLRPVTELVGQSFMCKRDCDNQLTGQEPDEWTTLSQSQARLMLAADFGDWPDLDSSRTVVLESEAAADTAQRLALHAGWSANVDGRIVYLMRHEPIVGTGKINTRRYKGRVHCVTVPGHVFYMRRKGVPSWTGNSTRSGNKAIVATLLSRADMPFAESGETPDIITNPHSIPSRMTIGQMLETGVAQVCARRGTTADSTVFLPTNLEDIKHELESVGLRASGRERMYNGMTGEVIDEAISFGIVYEQRLQKFVKDDEYAAASSGPTDATTGQPLPGKQTRGGLRIGEMEEWCYVSHGSMQNLFELFSTNSDGRPDYICRACGYPAKYNPKHHIYRCEECKEFTDIVAIDTGKAAIALMHELHSSNVACARIMRPREFEMPEAEYAKKARPRRSDKGTDKQPTRTAEVTESKRPVQPSSISAPRTIIAPSARAGIPPAKKPAAPSSTSAPRPAPAKKA